MTEDRPPNDLSPDLPPAEPAQPPPAGASLPPAPPPAPESNIRPLPPRPDRSALSSGEYWRQRSDNLLAQLGIDAGLAGRVLVVAVIAALIAALLDEILGLPGVTLRVSFGGTLVAGLSGMSYAYFKGREDAPGLIMAAVSGLVAYLVWFIVKEIVGNTFLNIPKAMVSGALAGMIGFGWLVLLREIPRRLKHSR